MAGRPLGAQNKDKPFRDALRMELAAAGEDHKALRRIAAALIEKAAEGDVSAIKEVADRLDGKVAQAIAGPDGEGPVEMDLNITNRERAKAVLAAIAKAESEN
jgi:hypothetical protein